MSQKVELANRNIADLAPFFAQRLQLALAECVEKGYNVELFEGYRNPERQNFLYEKGRSTSDKIVTWARAGQSFHNVSLAADVVYKIKGKWCWSEDYDKVEQIMVSHGFSSLKVERCHFQITGGLTISQAWNIAKTNGLMHLWSIVEGNINCRNEKIKTKST